MKRHEKRAHLIAVAARLFNRYGYHAAGVDRVIAEAGVAKTTLYRHFPTKDDLIVAVLQFVDEDFRNAMRASVERSTSDPAERLFATFDYLEEWFEGDAFYGCPFVSAAAEYADGPSPVFHQAVLHKRLMLAYFEELARAAGFADPKEAAATVHLLHEGAVSVAQVNDDASVARTAKAAARKLLAKDG